MPWSPRLLLSLQQGQAQAQSWSDLLHTHLGVYLPQPPYPYPHLEPSSLGGDCLTCDVIKGRGRTQRLAGHNERPVPEPLVLSPGARAFPPSDVNASELGPEYVAEAPHTPRHSLDHLTGLHSLIFVSLLSMDLPQST